MECSLHSGSYLCVKGTIAGIDKAEVEYHFNNNGLESAIYSLVRADNDEGACDSIFKEINGILKNKYGNPDDITKTVIESQYIETCVLSKAAVNASNFSWFKYSVPDLQVYTQEIDDDTLVAIVPVIIRAYHQGYLIEQLKIEYHIYSKESIEKAILEISSDQAQAIEKLNDDL